MRGVQELLAFNRGRISRKALARLDLKKPAMAAEVQTNWMPAELGSMSLRPGWQKLLQVANNDHQLIPFIFSSTDTALIELTPGQMRVIVNDEVLTSSAYTATITNGGFDTDVTGWTDADDAGATSQWVTGGYLGLRGTGSASATRHQLVTISTVSVEYRIQIVVARGPVTLRIGSTSTSDNFFPQAILGTGTHNIAFTPSANFYIQLGNREDRQTLVTSVSAYAASTAVVVTAPWTADHMDCVRWRQSGDVVYVACYGVQQYKIERRDNDSWSVVKYEPLDGPFRLENVTDDTITSSVLAGSGTLTSSAPMFRSTSVGALYLHRSVGQKVSDSISAEDTWTNAITVTGIGESRRFAIKLAGTFSATVTLQQSFDEGTTWQDVTTYTATASTTYLDALDNQIVQYRIGIATGDYTSGTVVATLNYSAGSITGVVKITGYTSTTSVSIDVVKALGSTTATPYWAEGAWSDRRGWPSAVEFHDGRLFFAGKDNIWGSVTDAYESFDPDYEGDAGPINRTIGFGPVDNINWLLSLGRLVAGCDGSEITFRSSSLDEPLTPSNFTPKETGTQGSAGVQAVKIDGMGAFVQRSGYRLYRVSFDPTQNDYAVSDLSAWIPDIGSPSISAIAVQRQPDTRVHCIRSDGTVALLLFNSAEELTCWVDVETYSGDLVKQVAVLPGTAEDAVYYTVKRGSNTYLEKWALQSEAEGAAVTKLADSFVYAAGSSSGMTGLDHLEGRTVVLWGNGKDQGTAVVSSGQVLFPEACTNRCAGLAYTADFKSTKLAYVHAQGKSGLGARKKIAYLGLVLTDTHYQGLEFGPDFDNLDPLPASESFEVLADDTIHTDYEGDLIEFGGEWSVDSRLCLRATAPRPCTVLGAVIDMETNSK